MESAPNGPGRTGKLIMKVVVSGGGTGGHVYPALSVIQALQQPTQSSFPALRSRDILWIGSRGGMEEEMVHDANIDFVGLSAGGLRGQGVLVQIRGALQIITSTGRAQRVLRRFKPDIVLVTGGYACVATSLAAWLLHIPITIYLPDVVPGLAIKFLSRFATKIAVTSEESYHYFRPEKVLVTGYPVRSSIHSLDPKRARIDLGLDPDETTLLVFGGSRGARSINKTIVAGLRELLDQCQIIHISGRLDADWVAGASKGLPEVLRTRYRHFQYLSDMPKALVAANLAVARAGAATLGEFPAAGLPSILVPYPHSGQHQRANAEYMVRNGAAQMILDHHIGERLVPTILRILDNRTELAAMQESARAMGRTDAAQTIADHLWSMARHGRSDQMGKRS